VAPSLNFRRIQFDGMRVPRMIGLPASPSGQPLIRSVIVILRSSTFIAVPDNSVSKLHLYVQGE